MKKIQKSGRKKSEEGRRKRASFRRFWLTRHIKAPNQSCKLVCSRQGYQMTEERREGNEEERRSMTVKDVVLLASVHGKGQQRDHFTVKRVTDPG